MQNRSVFQLTNFPKEASMRHHNKLNILRVIAIVMTLLLLSMQWMPAVSAASTTQKGKCGKELSWTFYAGTLTISGKGEMTDYTELEMAPWYDYREEITRVVFPDGMTSVGKLAFYGCENISTVILPDTVRKIGNYAFTGCESIVMLDLGDSLTSIGKLAFYGCKSLKNVQLPYLLESIGDQAFYLCESLKTIKVQSNVTKMGHSVFAYCKSLITAEISARVNILPEWTFYGCEQLNIVTLSSTMSDADENAFKACEMLTTIYYDGDADSANSLKQAVVKDIPQFNSYGSVQSGTAAEINTSAVIQENEDGTETQHNVTVSENTNMTVVTELEHTREQNSTGGGNYKADISVTIEDKDGWNDATNAVLDSLKSLNESTNTGATIDKVDVIVYMKKDETPNTGFLQQVAGRDLELTVVSPDGLSWQLDCAIQEQETLTEQYDFSYQLSEASADTKKKLKSENCYQVKFDHSVTLNAEILIQLPSANNRSNAFLYQIEKDGTHTRLQAVMIDQKGVAHFYLASVNKDTTYVIGINIPGENTDDIIVPDELAADYGGAFIRVERIEYVSTGVQSSWGLSFWQVTFIMIAVLVTVIVVVGVVMAMMNKRRLQNELAAANGAPTAQNTRSKPAKVAKSNDKPAKAGKSNEKRAKKDSKKSTKKK